jgi:hypothetical protein
VTGKHSKVFKFTIHTVPVAENEGTLTILKLSDIFLVPKLVIFPTKYIFGN